MNPPNLQDIARVFLHLGASAFGGLAMLEPIRRRVVDGQAWLSQRDFLDGLALCQMVPGATVVQMAAYVGYRLRGAAGGLTAAAAFILPAFFLMGGLSLLYFHYGELAWVKSASRGLNAVVIALLLQSLWGLGQAVGRRLPDLLVAAAALAALAGRVNYFGVFLLAGLARLGLEVLFGGGESSPSEAAPEPRARVKTAVIQGLAAAGGLMALAWGLGRLDPILGELTGIFIKIGVISFGGGYVMIPILQWEVVDRLGWLTLRQFLDGILLSYVTPGPLLILAVFVGYFVKGLPGAILSTLGVFLPPVLIIFWVFPFYQRIKESRWVRPALQGILAALVAMLALVTLELSRSALTHWKDLALLAGGAAALMVFRVNLLWVAAAAAGMSLLIY
ncbi:MAG: chromate efflux transporter [Deltaproteobacteria bacterium]|nr:chromate efflux transporter [Deltaproteobacteria bacterium]